MRSCSAAAAVLLIALSHAQSTLFATVTNLTAPYCGSEATLCARSVETEIAGLVQHQVLIGGFVTRASGLDPNEARARLSGSVWMKWKLCSKDKDKLPLRPDLTGMFRNTLDRTGTFTIMPLHPEPVCDVVPDYAYQRWWVEGHFQEAFDFRFYPVDAHEIKIDVQDAYYSRRELVYVPDRPDKAAVAKSVEMRGWNIVNSFRRERPITYSSDFGLGDGQEAVWTRFEFGIVVQRGIAIYFFRVLPPIIIMLMTQTLVFAIDTSSTSALASKLSAAAGALLTTAFLHSSLAGNIPKNIDYLTLLDWHFFVCYLVTIGVLIACVHVYKYGRKLASVKSREKQVEMMALAAEEAAETQAQEESQRLGAAQVVAGKLSHVCPRVADACSHSHQSLSLRSDQALAEEREVLVPQNTLDHAPTNLANREQVEFHAGIATNTSNEQISDHSPITERNSFQSRQSPRQLLRDAEVLRKRNKRSVYFEEERVKKQISQLNRKFLLVFSFVTVGSFLILGVVAAVVHVSHQEV